jgi:hypothetical protein
MKTIRVVLLTIVCAISVALYPQKPIDPAITKFNAGAAFVNAGNLIAAIADFEDVIVIAENLSYENNASKTPRLQVTQSYIIQYIKLCEPLCLRDFVALWHC